MATTSTDVRGEGERISAVSRMLGIPIPTIRSWERRYSFPTPLRTGGRHRRYTPAEVAQLRAVRDRITYGERVQAAIRAVRQHGVELAPSSGALNAFVAAANSIDPGGLRRVLRDEEATIGPERTIGEIALPGMRMIGLRWRAGEVDVATEHMATEAVRHWLASLGPDAPPPTGAPILLACAPGERHTLGLEAFAVLLARRGFATRMLGANTPESSLVSAIRTTHARAVVLTAHRTVVRRAAIAAITTIDRLSGVRVLYAGNAFATATARDGVPGVYLGDDVLAAVSIAEAAIH